MAGHNRLAVVAPKGNFAGGLVLTLEEMDALYDEGERLLKIPFQGPGYHSRLANGTMSHPTRESASYALDLLETGEPWRVERAGEILGRLVELQETDPTAKTYGIWSWLSDEPLSEMDPPDWNWADFVGMRLAKALRFYEARLSQEVAAEVRTALGHAAWSIFRRNVGPSYTNISIMGAGVAVAAGELLGEPRLVAYGRTRLRRMVEHVERNGEFDEYNSPTYTVVTLDEAENILLLVQDESTLADAEWLRRKAWLTIAEHYHPPSGQWAGPHGRSYGDPIDPGIIPGLLRRTPGCPADLRERFERLPEPVVTLRRRYVSTASDETSVWGTTWLSEAACLASTDREILWHQKRPLVGYWRTAGGAVAVLRVRFLHDGRDFASGYLRCAQAGARILTAAHLIRGGGDFHPNLNLPKDGRFTTSDLRLRWELTSPDVSVIDDGNGRYRLGTDVMTAALATTPVQFGGQATRWEANSDGKTAYVDAVCYQGEPWTFDPGQIEPVVIVSGVELVGNGEAADDWPVETRVQGDVVDTEWGGLRVSAPTRAQRLG
jgi:hypothetical protein